MRESRPVSQPGPRSEHPRPEPGHGVPPNPLDVPVAPPPRGDRPEHTEIITPFFTDVPTPRPPVGETTEHTELISSFFTDEPARPAAREGRSGPPADLFGGTGDGFTAGEGGSYGPDDATITSTRRQRTPAAGGGWRRAVAKMTGGVINPGPSAREEEHAARLEKIHASLTGVHKVAFVNAKGGVGKTTMTVATGSAISLHRGDRVIAVDVNTDLGDLSSRFSEDGGSRANVEALAALANDEQRARRDPNRRRGTGKDSGQYSTVREFTVQNTERLEALGSQNDPRSNYRLNARDYAAAMRVLETHYNVVLLDCGTAITAPLFSTIAEDVDALVVVASQNTRGINGAKNTLAWLAAHGFGRLLDRTVIVLNATDRGKPLVNLDAVETAFRQYVPEVVTVPYDPHLAQGTAIAWSQLQRRTREGLLKVAGAVAEHYPVRHTEERGL